MVDSRNRLVSLLSENKWIAIDLINHQKVKEIDVFDTIAHTNEYFITEKLLSPKMPIRDKSFYYKGQRLGIFGMFDYNEHIYGTAQVVNGI